MPPMETIEMYANPEERRITLPEGTTWQEAYPDAQMSRGFEGGAVYTAEDDDGYYVIVNDGTAVILDEDEGKSLLTVSAFETKEDRHAYLVDRDWIDLRQARRNAVSNRRQAELDRREAERDRGIAERKRREAERDRGIAERNRNKAERDLVKAERDLRKAERDLRRAERKER